jgi:KipI family sensor histidine kinase inhibitor
VSLEFRVRELVEGFLLVEFPGASEDSANRVAVTAARRLAGRPGLLDAIPGARTLFLVCDPRAFPRPALERDLEAAVSDADARTRSRAVRLPVRYGGEPAPDLPELARSLGILPDEFARRHAAATYRVAFLGFAPGFAYCVGLPEELASPRLATPRTRIPAGAVAIGGSYTGVYPAETPGGWRLIGRSSARFFDPTADPPTLLLPGDSVAFELIGDEDPELRSPDHPPSPGRPPDGALFRVQDPGLFTSLQGAPRFGRGAYGVPAGGAMDAASLAAGNALVGNAGGAAALEVTLTGLSLEALADCRAATAGARVTAQINGVAAVAGRSFGLRRGDRLLLSRVSSGVRAYLCVAGGLAIPSTEWQTRRLSKGDIVCGSETDAVPLTADVSPRPQARGSVGVVLGPQEDRFDERGIASFLSQAWRVSASSDRRGVRLEGEPLPHVGSAEIAPEGTAFGAIQVPPDGQPIVLGPDRPVTGGYAKIATVLAPDWPVVAQAAPGALLRFHVVRR